MNPNVNFVVDDSSWTEAKKIKPSEIEVGMFKNSAYIPKVSDGVANNIIVYSSDGNVKDSGTNISALTGKMDKIDPLSEGESSPILVADANGNAQKGMPASQIESVGRKWTDDITQDIVNSYGDELYPSIKSTWNLYQSGIPVATPGTVGKASIAANTGEFQSGLEMNNGLISAYPTNAHNFAMFQTGAPIGYTNRIPITLAIYEYAVYQSLVNPQYKVYNPSYPDASQYMPYSYSDSDKVKACNTIGAVNAANVVTTVSESNTDTQVPSAASTWRAFGGKYVKVDSFTTDGTESVIVRDYSTLSGATYRKLKALWAYITLPANITVPFSSWSLQTYYRENSSSEKVRLSLTNQAVAGGNTQKISFIHSFQENGAWCCQWIGFGTYGNYNYENVKTNVKPLQFTAMTDTAPYINIFQVSIAAGQLIPSGIVFDIWGVPYEE